MFQRNAEAAIHYGARGTEAMDHHLCISLTGAASRVRVTPQPSERNKEQALLGKPE